MESYYFSAPGRTELGGNHTDHQHGCILAASVNLETTASVTRRKDGMICIRSEGYPEFSLSVNALSPRDEERGTSAALVRGVLNAFRELGTDLHGFDAEIRSAIPVGSGLSSSAAFEVLIGTVCNTLFAENQLTPTQIAKIGQQAENVYFGKPCGLMDQLACALGGVCFMDFENPDAPATESLNFDLGAAGYSLCIIHTGGNHTDLTAEYAAIPGELQTICRQFGKTHLRQVPESDFYAALPTLREKVPHRAILRAMHIYNENARVKDQAAALKQNDLPRFLELVKQSGRSSWMYLQNIYPAGATDQQPMALALALCEKLLNGQGAFRVHGGGFAGTVQAFVPNEILEKFQTGICAVFGENACRVTNFRATGCTQMQEV